MLHLPLRGATRLLTLALLTAATATLAEGQTPRRVYVLAGQSNTAELRSLKGIGCGIPGVPPTNVSYAEATSSAGTLGPWALTPIPLSDLVGNSRPLLGLGNRLGAAFPNEQVELVMIAQSGSALLWRNFAHSVLNPVPGLMVNGAWVDQANPGSGLTWMNLMAPVMGALGLTANDSLHFVWGQGESDCLVGMNTATQEYMDWAQIVFGVLAAHAGKTEYVVHLVTLGALYVPPATIDGADMNRVRDAFFGMPDNVLPLPSVQATILPAAHHYDLTHRDPAHLTPCSSVQLAGRIADGILTPNALPLRADATPTVVGTTDIVIPTTAALATVPFGQASNKFFEVTVGGATVSPSDFEVAASGSTLTVRVLTGGVTASNFTVRHVAGTGFGLDWETMPTLVDAALGLPLEPFVAP